MARIYIKDLFSRTFKGKEVYCPRCGSLVGFQFNEEETKKIEKLRFKVGDKELPVVEIEKLGAPPLFCEVCGYTWSPEKR